NSIRTRSSRNRTRARAPSPREQDWRSDWTSIWMDRQRIQECSWRSATKSGSTQPGCARLEETRAKNSAGRGTGSARTGENDQVQSTHAAGPKSRDGVPAARAPEQCAPGARPVGVRQSVHGQAVAAVAHPIEVHSAYGKDGHRRRRRWLAQLPSYLFHHVAGAGHRPKGPAGVAALRRYLDDAGRVYPGLGSTEEGSGRQGSQHRAARINPQEQPTFPLLPSIAP